MAAIIQPAAAYDAIVVGGGHNGLVAAAYLAKAGLRTILLEKRATLGGTVETRTLDDGSRAPGLFHTVGRLRPAVFRELDLGSRGLSLVAPEVRAFAPQPDGRAVTLWADNERTAADLETWSGADALAWAGFDRRVRSLAAFLGALAEQAPPATAGTGPGRRDHRPPPRPRLQEALPRGRPGPAARPADGRRGLRRRGIRARRRPGDGRRPGRPVHRPRRVVDGHDRDAPGGLRRQRRRRRRPGGRRPRRARGGQRRPRRRGARLRGRAADRRRGRGRHHGRRAGHRRRPRLAGRRSRRRSSPRASTRSGRSSGSSARSTWARTCAGGPATSASRGRWPR